MVLHFDPNPVAGTPTGWAYPACAAQVEAHIPPNVPKTFAGVGAMRPESNYCCPGRLTVECVELDDIKGKDKSLKAFVEFKLGKETKMKVKTSSVDADETGRDVKFDAAVHNSWFVFDVTDPNEIKQDDDIELVMGGKRGGEGRGEGRGEGGVADGTMMQKIQTDPQKKTKKTKKSQCSTTTGQTRCCATAA